MAAPSEEKGGRVRVREERERGKEGDLKERGTEDTQKMSEKIEFECLVIQTYKIVVFMTVDTIA